MLLDELGLTRGLLEPLVCGYLAPLCARLPELAPRANIDQHKVRARASIIMIHTCM